MTHIKKTLGPTFIEEYKAAGLLHIPISWNDDGVTVLSEIKEDIDAVKKIVDAHDPAAFEKVDYINKRAKAFALEVPAGDQFDAAFKDRTNRQLVSGKVKADNNKAKEALEAGDLSFALKHITNAIDHVAQALNAGASSDIVDSRISDIKERYPQPEGEK